MLETRKKVGIALIATAVLINLLQLFGPTRVSADAGFIGSCILILSGIILITSYTTTHIHIDKPVDPNQRP